MDSTRKMFRGGGASKFSNWLWKLCYKTCVPQVKTDTDVCVSNQCKQSNQQGTNSTLSIFVALNQLILTFNNFIFINIHNKQTKNVRQNFDTLSLSVCLSLPISISISLYPSFCLRLSLYLSLSLCLCLFFYPPPPLRVFILFLMFSKVFEPVVCTNLNLKTIFEEKTMDQNLNFIFRRKGMKNIRVDL